MNWHGRKSAYKRYVRLMAVAIIPLAEMFYGMAFKPLNVERSENGILISP
jgi:hypothetical protein